MVKVQGDSRVYGMGSRAFSTAAVSDYYTVLPRAGFLTSARPDDHVRTLWALEKLTGPEKPT